MANRNYDIDELFGWTFIGVLALMGILGLFAVARALFFVPSSASLSVIAPFEEVVVTEPVQERPRPVARPVAVPVVEPTSEPVVEKPIRRLPDGFVSQFASIMSAAERGTVNDVIYHLQNGADVNMRRGDSRNQWNETPLHRTLQYNSCIEIVKVLVEHGADLDARNMGGSTPLHHLVWARNFSEEYFTNVLEYLVEHGADVNAKRSNDGVTPLDIATREEQRRILRAAGGKLASELE